LAKELIAAVAGNEVGGGQERGGQQQEDAHHIPYDSLL
jgi:hypothetical protein